MLKYEHLLGRPFDWTTNHCYQLQRDFYRDNFDIHLRSYACPHEWWKYGLSLFMNLYPREGFEPVEGGIREYRAGDLILMAYDAPVANHMGVLLDNGQMLHHMVGTFSATVPYANGGFWRSKTVGVIRHPGVTYTAKPATLDLRSLMNGPSKQKLDAAFPDGRDDELAAGLDGAGWVRLE
jgi:hypothetical protein